MKKTTSQAGFTLIETLIAIFLLTLTIGGLMTLAANGYFSVRYAKNQIIANNLVQESLEYIRNDRDTSFQQGLTWQQWEARYAGNSGCFNDNGCIIDPYATQHVTACTSATCDESALTFYPEFGFYGYAADSATYPVSFVSATVTAPYLTTYKRIIKMKESVNDPNQVTVTASMSWLNGSSGANTSQSMLLTNWHY